MKVVVEVPLDLGVQHLGEDVAESLEYVATRLSYKKEFVPFDRGKIGDAFWKVVP